ncbi:hypothetical protein BKA81DRAFT_88333 [Phyllosticta paracitricarpa]
MSFAQSQTPVGCPSRAPRRPKGSAVRPNTTFDGLTIVSEKTTATVTTYGLSATAPLESTRSRSAIEALQALQALQACQAPTRSPAGQHSSSTGAEWREPMCYFCSLLLRTRSFSHPHPHPHPATPCLPRHHVVAHVLQSTLVKRADPNPSTRWSRKLLRCRSSMTKAPAAVHIVALHCHSPRHHCVFTASFTPPPIIGCDS